MSRVSDSYAWSLRSITSREPWVADKSALLWANNEVKEQNKMYKKLQVERENLWESEMYGGGLGGESV